MESGKEDYEVKQVDESDEYYYFKKLGEKRQENKSMKFVQPPMWSKLPVKKEEATSTELEEIVREVEVKSFPVEDSKDSHFKTRKNSLDDITDSAKFILKLKIRSNELIKKKDYRGLCELYTTALNRYPDNPDFYCNRSLAFYKMEYYGQAISECDKAIELDSNYKRAYYRRAAAFVAQGQLFNALKDYEHLKNSCPNSGKINCLFLHCKEALNKTLFGLLLAESKSDHNIEDLVNYKDIVMDDKDRIPKLRGEKVTASFVSELLRFYKRHSVTKLHRKTVYKILFNARKVLKAMPSLIYIDITDDEDRITVCGDAHGQLNDVVYMILTNGFPSAKNRYLFNGNFIGKGYSNVEVALLLLSMKTVFPARVFLARGHQESSAMTRIFGFENEVNEKYNAVVYELFIEVFKWLPLAHIINRKVIVLHGGLFSNDGITVDNIKSTTRNIEPDEDAGLVRDIIWSDPKSQNGKQVNFRGMGGIRFGPDVTEDFLDRNHLNYIIRSHEYVLDGYKEEHGGKCITVFSTPNYCGFFQNRASMILLTGPNLSKRVITYKVNPHPTGKKALHYADTIFALDI